VNGLGELQLHFSSPPGYTSPVARMLITSRAVPLRPVSCRKSATKQLSRRCTTTASRRGPPCLGAPRSVLQTRNHGRNSATEEVSPAAGSAGTHCMYATVYSRCCLVAEAVPECTFRTLSFGAAAFLRLTIGTSIEVQTVPGTCVCICAGSLRSNVTRAIRTWAAAFGKAAALAAACGSLLVAQPQPLLAEPVIIRCMP